MKTGAWEAAAEASTAAARLTPRIEFMEVGMERNSGGDQSRYPPVRDPDNRVNSAATRLAVARDRRRYLSLTNGFGAAGIEISLTASCTPFFHCNRVVDCAPFSCTYHSTPFLSRSL